MASCDFGHVTKETAALCGPLRTRERSRNEWLAGEGPTIATFGKQSINRLKFKALRKRIRTKLHAQSDQQGYFLLFYGLQPDEFHPRGLWLLILSTMLTSGHQMRRF